MTDETVFDAGARVFELRPILALLAMPVFIVVVVFQRTILKFEIAAAELAARN